MRNPMIWLLGGYMWLFLHRPFEVWTWLGDIHIERVYMIITFAYWLLASDKVWIANRLNLAFASLWCVMLASFLFSPYNSATVENYFKVALLYVLLITTVREERDLQFIVVIFLVSMGLYMTHSFREYLCGRTIYRMGFSRMIGVDATYNDPNTFSASILYSLPFVYAVWGLASRPWHRKLLIGYVALAILCILLTGSRSAFVGLCFLAVVAAVLSKHRFRVTAALAVAAPIVWLCLSASLQDRFYTLIDPSTGPRSARVSAESREEGWTDGVKMWRAHPLLGVGPGAFPAARGYKLESHHLYGQVLGEVGTLGAIAFAAVVLCFIANYRELARWCRIEPWLRDTFPARLVRAVTMAVALLLLMGFGGHNLFRYTWVWFGAFQALAMSCAAQRLAEPLELETPLDAYSAGFDDGEFESLQQFAT